MKFSYEELDIKGAYYEVRTEWTTLCDQTDIVYVLYEKYKSDESLAEKLWFEYQSLADRARVLRTVMKNMRSISKAGTELIYF